MSNLATSITTTSRPRPKSRLTCSCCGGDAGFWTQFHNQDTGYGMCAPCIDSLVARGPAYLARHEIDINRTWGLPGVHRAPAAHETTNPNGENQ